MRKRFLHRVGGYRIRIEADSRYEPFIWDGIIRDNRTNHWFATRTSYRTIEAVKEEVAERYVDITEPSRYFSGITANMRRVAKRPKPKSTRIKRISLANLNGPAQN
jgi:hypothetical protein